MAYPGVLMVDDATIFKALSRTGEERRADLHARRERRRDRRDRAARAGGGQDGADVSRADAAGDGRGGGGAPRHRAGGDRGRAGLHRAPVVGGRAEPGARGARPRRAGVRRDVPAVPAAFGGRAGAAGLRGRQVRLHAAAAGETPSAQAVGRAQERPLAGGLDRPLPVLLRGPEGRWARTISRRSPTAGRASRTGCSCSITTA